MGDQSPEQDRHDAPNTVKQWSRRQGMRVVGVIVVLVALCLIVLVGLAVVGGNSGRTKPATAEPAPAPNTGNRANDLLATLPADLQAVALGKIVNDGCDGHSAFYMGISPSDHGAFWSVRCRDGRSYQITIEANATGSTSSMDCAALKAIADLDCFVRMDDQSHRPPRTKQQIKADIDRLPPRLKRELMDSLKRNIGKP
jgi:hypothetical protein